MAVALVQSRVVGAATSTITLPAWSPAPVVGNIGIVVAELFRSGTSAPTVTAPTGWTTVLSDVANNTAASVQVGLAIFMRRFDGTTNDAASGMTTTAASYRVVAHELSGLAADAVTTAVVGATTRLETTTTNPTQTAAVAPAQTRSWVFTAAAARTAAAPTAVAWGGGSAAVVSQLATNGVVTGGQQLGDTFGAPAPTVTLTASVQGQVTASLALRTPDSRPARLRRGTGRAVLRRWNGTAWVTVPLKRYNRATGVWEGVN